MLDHCLVKEYRSAYDMQQDISWMSSVGWVVKNISPVGYTVTYVVKRRRPKCK